MKSYNFILFLFYNFAICFVYPLLALRIEGILNGDLVNNPRYTYEAAILGKKHGSGTLELIGSGALIDDNHVLSAAHLFINECYNLKPLTFYVRLGETDLNRIGKTLYVENFYVLGYCTETYLDNLILLKIGESDTKADRPWKVLQTFPPNWQTLSKREGTVSSYGIHNTDDHLDKKLRYANATIVENSNCLNISDTESSQMCIKMNSDDAGRPKGLCKYDGGAPFVVDGHYLAGIASQPKENCDDTEKGSIYTAVRPFEKLIEAIISKFAILPTGSHGLINNPDVPHSCIIT